MWREANGRIGRSAYKQSLSRQRIGYPAARINGVEPWTPETVIEANDVGSARGRVRSGSSFCYLPSCLWKSWKRIDSIKGFHIARLLPGILQLLLMLGCPSHYESSCTRWKTATTQQVYSRQRPFETIHTRRENAADCDRCSTS